MSDEIDIKDYDIDPETGEMPKEFYEQEHRLGLATAAKDIPKLVRDADLFVDGIQELYDDWDEESAYIQETESREWENDISSIEFLEELRKQGRLTDPQGRKFVAIVERFKTHLPQIRHMDLYVPEFLQSK